MILHVIELTNTIVLIYQTSEKTTSIYEAIQYMYNISVDQDNRFKACCWLGDIRKPPSVQWASRHLR